MKKFLMLPLVFFATHASAEQLFSFQQIQHAAANGKRLHIVINFPACFSASKAAIKTMAIGAYTPDAVAITEGNIASSLLHFTLNDPYFPNQPVYEFVRTDIAADNTVTLTTSVRDAATYKDLGQGMPKVVCTLNGGAKVYS